MNEFWNKLIFLLQLIKLLFKFKRLLNFLIKSINHPIFIVINRSLNSTARLITASRICKVKPKVVFVYWLINVKQYNERSLMNMFVMMAVWRPTTLSTVLLMRAFLVCIIKNVKAKLWRRKIGGHSLLIPIVKTATFQRTQSLSSLI